MQFWKEMHTVGAPIQWELVPRHHCQLPSFLPPNDRGKGSRRTGPNRSFAPLFPLWDCVLETMDHTQFISSISFFTATWKFTNHFGNKMKTYHLLFGHWWICWKICFMINVTLNLTTWCEFSLSESGRNYKIIQEIDWSYRIVRIFSFSTVLLSYNLLATSYSSSVEPTFAY